MVSLDQVSGSLLQKPSDTPHPALTRVSSSYHPLRTFHLDRQRSYQQQFSDMYFLRLTKIKPAVEQIAADTWDGTVIAGELAKRAERVLDVRQGELCWVTGTVYMTMCLKPNILEDVSKDRWISAPISTDRYFSNDDRDEVMLEDDSGRIKLVGAILKSVPLVTGCIVAVMGTENSNGELEVIDIKFPDLAPQPERWALTDPAANPKDLSQDHAMSDLSPPASPASGSKVAIISGLSFSSHDSATALELDLLLEYLLGEALGPDAQRGAAQISRVIVAGNSISGADERAKPTAEPRKPGAAKKYGYDASTYNPLPSQLLDDFLAQLLPSVPVTLLPGSHDPANSSFPQQPIHPAMFPRAKAYCAAPGVPAPDAVPGWLDTVTNPWEGEVDGWRFLGTGGQNVDDVFKYVGSEDRLGMMEAMCRWRCSAPTAPDTLWSYPFQDNDPFVMDACPHVYFVGCQPKFSTKLIDGPEGQKVRLITVPSFSVTRELVLVDTATLEVTKVQFAKAAAPE